MSALEIRRLKAFGHQVWGDAERDLSLLRNIETTLDSLDIELERTKQLNQASEEFITLLKNTELSNLADNCGDLNLVTLFDAARDIVGKMHTKLAERRQIASTDPALREDDGIVQSFDTLLSEVAVLHNNLNQLSWLIGENKADFDKVIEGNYTNSKDLFDAMGI
jgi:hypothetical protein